MSYTRATGPAAAEAAFREMFFHPYVYGGEWPEDDGTDCAGATQFAWGQAGVRLARTSEEQAAEYPCNDRALPNQLGDLLFIPGDPVDENPGHVVFYISPGVVYEAEETGTTIGQFPFDTDAWEFRTRPALALPEPPPPPPPPVMPPARGHPTPGQLKKAGLVGLADVAQAEQAQKDGFDLWYWSATHFVAQVQGDPKGVALYVNKKFEIAV